MSGPGGRNCEGCHYWLLGDGVGVCRRHAPLPATAAERGARLDRYYVRWPHTSATDWCGEWTAVQAPPT